MGNPLKKLRQDPVYSDNRLNNSLQQQGQVSSVSLLFSQVVICSGNLLNNQRLGVPAFLGNRRSNLRRVLVVVSLDNLRNNLPPIRVYSDNLPSSLPLERAYSVNQPNQRNRLEVQVYLDNPHNNNSNKGLVLLAEVVRFHAQNNRLDIRSCSQEDLEVEEVRHCLVRNLVSLYSSKFHIRKYINLLNIYQV